jgi:nitrogen fixation protein FixH
MSTKPSTVGDLIEFIVTYTPPIGDPTGKVTAATMLIKDPAGTETSAPGLELSDNVWRFVASERIDAPGDWYVRVNANAGLIDSIELHLSIRPSEFATPLPP